LPEGLVPQALDAARAIEHDYGRAEALAGLAPRLPEGLRQEAVAQALDAVCAIEYGRDRAVALARLAPHLPVGLRQEVLSQALDAARAIEDDYDRALALGALAQQVTKCCREYQYSFWRATLLSSAARTRPDLLRVLRALLPVVVQLGGPQAAADAFRAIQDVGDWWP
jgi:hypothetical protein